MPRLATVAFALAAVLSQVIAAPTSHSYSGSYDAKHADSYDSGSWADTGAKAYAADSKEYYDDKYADKYDAKDKVHIATVDYKAKAYHASSTWKHEPTKVVYKAAAAAADDHKVDDKKHDVTSTSTSYHAKATDDKKVYGSGYASWGGKGYNDCVQQCMASYGAPSTKYVPAVADKAASDADHKASKTTASGAVHTVIVAPTQGVLRYVPFSIDAQVGDTVRFVWGANNHTVTKGSALTPCNKTADADTFASGLQVKGFVFEQVVTTTEPTYYFCAAPGHCQKGMFGIINPPKGTVGQQGTIGTWMQSHAATDASMAALWNYVSDKTSGTSAEGWGLTIDMSKMSVDDDVKTNLAENAMYSQLFYAANPGMIEAGQGAAAVNGTDIVIPADITKTLNQLAAQPIAVDVSAGSNAVVGQQAAQAQAAETPSVVSSASVSAAAADATKAAASTGEGSSTYAYSNGSGRMASSTLGVGAIALLASLFVL